MISADLISRATGVLLTSNNIGALANAIFDGGDDADETIKCFRASLEKASGVIRRDTSKPMILIVDELDRCHPPYAIDMLENIKHLFSTKNVVFVLVVNLKELGHSIRSVYGEWFNVESYLRRFRDFDFKLPDANEERRLSISKRFRSIGLGAYAAQTKARDMESRITRCDQFFADFAIVYGMSLRDIEQYLKRVEVAYSKIRYDRVASLETFMLLLVLRHLNAAMLDRFMRHDISDFDYVSEVLGMDTHIEAVKRNHKLLAIALIMYGDRSRSTPPSEVNPEPRHDRTLRKTFDLRAAGGREDIGPIFMSGDDWQEIESI